MYSTNMTPELRSAYQSMSWRAYSPLRNLDPYDNRDLGDEYHEPNHELERLGLKYPGRAALTNLGLDMLDLISLTGEQRQSLIAS